MLHEELELYIWPLPSAFSLAFLAATGSTGALPCPAASACMPLIAMHTSYCMPIVRAFARGCNLPLIMSPTNLKTVCEGLCPAKSDW